ncbi:MAG: amino acid ABC transporter permease [Kordiimonadaceae bacterium]|jgi:His/Glu/Gln/Arg/opine family amino acid ABC transporter permease subunit|nr:amino acid ABC transporter permease [Kordiimonadaceae bacterium]MBT6036233.1 amino acid ABC transporter permease [Kordiimonadaceae bacterium]MBT6330828.1 amino acid ABC transporter permease [Kordiimonadaceae bacterium]MBT7581484.1 amino acid ABC transporter permease [Kordiimonadaceae bacterium]
MDGAFDIDEIRYIFFNMQVMEGQWGLLFSGLWMTVKIAVVAIIASTALGLLVSILRLKGNAFTNALLIGYLEFCRATPIVVALIVVYFGLPFLNITFSPFQSAVIVIVFVHAAYIGEAFRSGILAINIAQSEAAQSLGLTQLQTYRYILVPQAFRIVLPTLSNQWTGIIKDTSICTILAITELLKAAQIVAAWKANPTPLVMSTLLYLLILIPLTIFTMKLERKAGLKK